MITVKVNDLQPGETMANRQILISDETKEAIERTLANQIIRDHPHQKVSLINVHISVNAHMSVIDNPTED